MGLPILQYALAANPEARDIVSGNDGIRKICFALPGKGKRGGIKIIYYWQKLKDRVYMLVAYIKSKKSNVTTEETAILKRSVKEMLIMRMIMASMMAVSFILLSGCATYHSEGVRPNLSKITQKKEIYKDGVKIVVFPIINDEEIKYYFDNSDFQKYGLIPVYISIFNSNPETVIFNNVIIKAPDGIVYNAVSAEEVYRMIKTGVLGYTWRSYFWASFTYGVGLPFSILHSYKNNVARERDLKQKEINFHQEIQPYGILENFAYFKIGENKKIEGLMAVVVVIDKKEKTFAYEIPVTAAVDNKGLLVPVQ